MTKGRVFYLITASAVSAESASEWKRNDPLR